MGKDLMMQTFNNKAAIVTGASSGIGKAICYELAKYNARLVLAARRIDLLEELAKDLSPVEALPCPTDVTATEAVRTLVEKSISQYGQVDYLFNCAGSFTAGGLGDLSEETITGMMDLNYLGTVRCIKAVVPVMQQQGSGHIINLSSMLGKLVIPGSSAYSASKFAIAGMSNALRRELAHDDIHLSVIYPGFVYTPMINAHLDSVQNSILYRTSANYPPEKAAKAILKAVSKRKRELVIPSPLNSIAARFYGMIPGPLEVLLGKLSGGWPHYKC